MKLFQKSITIGEDKLSYCRLVTITLLYIITSWLPAKREHVQRVSRISLEKSKCVALSTLSTKKSLTGFFIDDSP